MQGRQRVELQGLRVEGQGEGEPLLGGGGGGGEWQLDKHNWGWEGCRWQLLDNLSSGPGTRT